LPLASVVALALPAVTLAPATALPSVLLVTRPLRVALPPGAGDGAGVGAGDGAGALSSSLPPQAATVADSAATQKRRARLGRTRLIADQLLIRV